MEHSFLIKLVSQLGVQDQLSLGLLKKIPLSKEASEENKEKLLQVLLTWLESSWKIRCAYPDLDVDVTIKKSIMCLLLTNLNGITISHEEVKQT